MQLELLTGIQKQLHKDMLKVNVASDIVMKGG